MIKLSIYIFNLYLLSMGHIVCRAQVTCVLHDGPKTHVAQQPNGYDP